MLLHSEWQKLYGVLAILSAIGLICISDNNVDWQLLGGHFVTCTLQQVYVTEDSVSNVFQDAVIKKLDKLQ